MSGSVRVMAYNLLPLRSSRSPRQYASAIDFLRWISRSMFAARAFAFCIFARCWRERRLFLPWRFLWARFAVRWSRSRCRSSRLFPYWAIWHRYPLAFTGPLGSRICIARAESAVGRSVSPDSKASRGPTSIALAPLFRRVSLHAATAAATVALSGCASKPEIAIQSYCEIKATELIDMRDRGIRGLSDANKRAVLASDDNWRRECLLGDRAKSLGPR